MLLYGVLFMVAIPSLRSEHRSSFLYTQIQAGELENYKENTHKKKPQQKVGHIFTRTSCSILYLAKNDATMNGGGGSDVRNCSFFSAQRHDIHSDPLAVRIICPVSFHKEPKDTKKSSLTKTKPLT